MSKSQPQILPTDRSFWFCLRAQTKREHFAAITLRKQHGIECFAPRLRMRKLTFTRDRGPRNPIASRLGAGPGLTGISGALPANGIAKGNFDSTPFVRRFLFELGTELARSLRTS